LQRPRPRHLQQVEVVAACPVVMVVAAIMIEIYFGTYNCTITINKKAPFNI
jgi:hypothetical protein